MIISIDNIDYKDTRDCSPLGVSELLSVVAFSETRVRSGN